VLSVCVCVCVCACACVCGVCALCDWTLRVLVLVGAQDLLADLGQGRLPEQCCPEVHLRPGVHHEAGGELRCVEGSLPGERSLPEDQRDGHDEAEESVLSLAVS
jgi:hypothetical protein